MKWSVKAGSCRNGSGPGLDFSFFLNWGVLFFLTHGYADLQHSRWEDKKITTT